VAKIGHTLSPEKPALLSGFLPRSGTTSVCCLGTLENLAGYIVFMTQFTT